MATLDKDALKKQLVKHEDLRLFVYDDATGQPIKKGDTLKGNPTIGVGRELSMHGISKNEAFIFLDDDIKEVTDELNKRIPWYTTKSSNVQRVLIGMAFNMGVGGLMGFTNMLRAIRKDDYHEAVKQMKDSLWAKQVGFRADDLESLLLR